MLDLNCYLLFNICNFIISNLNFLVQKKIFVVPNQGRGGKLV